MASGQMAPYSPYTLSARLLARIPDRMLATGSLAIALRVYISPAEWGAQGPGFSAGNIAIGQESTLFSEDWLAIIGEHALEWLDHVLNVCLGVVALVLLRRAQRRSTRIPVDCGGGPDYPVGNTPAGYLDIHQHSAALAGPFCAGPPRHAVRFNRPLFLVRSSADRLGVAHFLAFAA